jgi:hypothetical protein
MGLNCGVGNGVCGSTADAIGLKSNANGGGGGNGLNGYSGEPGGGGGHGIAGGGADSDFDVEGGTAAGVSNLNLMFFGGGAGAGGDNDGRTPFPEYVDGGGIAIVIGNKIVNATINADGEEGITPTSGNGPGCNRGRSRRNNLG